MIQIGGRPLKTDEVFTIFSAFTTWSIDIMEKSKTADCGTIDM